MPHLVWKDWAPPKLKFFAWLVIQDSVWTADRLERRGWPNRGTCQLCEQHNEMETRLLFGCRYSLRIWRAIKDLFGLEDLHRAECEGFASVRDWWSLVLRRNGAREEEFILPHHASLMGDLE